jgi:transcriptional regulator with XRE-family HTH domain
MQDGPMDDVRVGNTLRVLRIRNGLRQVDVARRAGVRREVVSRLERGGAGRAPLVVLRDVAGALGIRVDVRLLWQGGDLDRVMNEAHATLHGLLAENLTALAGWTWQPEVTFSHFGERGVIDILAWHAETRSLLIIELKTELVDPQELVATMHRRVRLGRQIANQLGWSPATISAWVVISDTRTNHRRVTRHSGLLRAAFPADGHAMRSWLRRPTGRIAALSFWTDVHPNAARRAPGQVKRVRTRPVASRVTGSERAAAQARPADGRDQARPRG